MYDEIEPKTPLTIIEIFYHPVSLLWSQCTRSARPAETPPCQVSFALEAPDTSSFGCTSSDKAARTGAVESRSTAHPWEGWGWPH